MKEKEVLEVWRRLDELARENPELYQKVMFLRHDADVCGVEQKERCRCDL